MKLNKTSLLKSVVYGFVLSVLNLMSLHKFPSLGHPPLDWGELASSWFLWLSLLLVLIFVIYVHIEDYNGNKNKDEEK